MAKSILILYTSATAPSLLSAAAHITYAVQNGYTYTLKDVAGVSDGDLTTYCGTTLVDATYDEIYVDCPCDTTAATATISTLHQYLLYPKLKVASRGTLGSEITNATTATATTLGDSGETWVVNAYTNTWIYLMGGTGTGQLATIKSNTATVATLWGTFATTPSTDTDFKLLSGMSMHFCGLAHTTTAATSVKNPVDLAWGAIYPNNTIPLVMSYHGGQPSFAVHSGTSSAVAASSITQSGAGWTTNQWAGMYVQIYAASTNGYQWGLIASNNTDTLTLTLLDATHYWSRLSTPTGTPTFKIVDHAGEIFCDLYSKYYINTYLTDLTSTAVLAVYQRMMNKNLSLNTLPHKFAPVQDINFVQQSVLTTGKTIYDALVLSVAL